jgi:hypothetical protein
VAIDAAGNVLIMDHGNYRVRRVNATTGTITTIAGNGLLASAANPLKEGPSLETPIRSSGRVTLDSAGNFYVPSLTCILKFDTSGNMRILAGMPGATRPSVTTFTTKLMDSGLPLDFYDIAVVNSTHFYVSMQAQNAVAALVIEPDANHTCNFTSMPQRDIVGVQLLHTTVTSEARCQDLCCQRSGCEGYAYSPPLPPASYASSGRIIETEFWRRVSDEPLAWHSSCYLYRNVTHSVYTSALRSGVLASLL